MHGFWSGQSSMHSAKHDPILHNVSVIITMGLPALQPHISNLMVCKLFWGACLCCLPFFLVTSFFRFAGFPNSFACLPVFPVRWFACSLVCQFADSPVCRFAGLPVRRFTGSPVRRFAGLPVRRFAGFPLDPPIRTSGSNLPHLFLELIGRFEPPVRTS